MNCVVVIATDRNPGLHCLVPYREAKEAKLHMIPFPSEGFFSPRSGCGQGEPLTPGWSLAAIATARAHAGVLLA